MIVMKKFAICLSKEKKESFLRWRSIVKDILSLMKKIDPRFVEPIF